MFLFSGFVDQGTEGAKKPVTEYTYPQLLIQKSVTALAQYSIGADTYLTPTNSMGNPAAFYGCKRLHHGA